MKDTILGWVAILGYLVVSILLVGSVLYGITSATAEFKKGLIKHICEQSGGCHER